MESGNYLDIIFFAAIAGYVFIKLRSVLGRKDGSEMNMRMNQKANSPVKAKTSQKKYSHLKPVPTVNETVNSDIELEDKKTQQQIDVIKTADPSFVARSFLEGAKAAFEMAIKAYSEKDKSTLRHLFTKDIYTEFKEEIDKNTAEGKQQENTLIAMNEANITGASLKRKKAQITVSFITEQINLVRDLGGKIIEGDTSDVESVTDSWVFERNLNSSDPNWVVIAV